MQLEIKKLKLVAVTFLVSISISSLATAQVVPDNSLPSNSSTIDQGSTTVINGGTQAGGNLFHSFEKFSIPTSGAAYFNNTLDVQNIISRITGGAASYIDGLIRANGTANLFLLNPNGIIFGANARLSIGGSFLASTASSLKFDEGTQFSATNTQTAPLLSVRVPIGLSFNSDPEPIYVRGTGHNLIASGFGFPPTVRGETSTDLRVQPGRTLALVGGDIVLEGAVLTAEGGRIELGSVGEGVVNLNPTNTSWNLDYASTLNFKNIQLSNQSLLDVSGFNSGYVHIQSSKIKLLDGSLIWSQNRGLEPGGNLSVNSSESLEISGASSNGTIRSGLLTEAVGAKKGGDIEISTKNLNIEKGASIATVTYSIGGGGDLKINASDSIKISKILPSIPSGRTSVGTVTYGFGSGGNNTVSTKNLTVVDSGILNTSTFGFGAGGDFNLSTENLTIAGGGNVGALTFGSSKGGNVFVKANNIELIGKAPEIFYPSVLNAATFGSGDAGDLTIYTSKLIVRDGARVDTATVASGNAGNLSIEASDSIEVTGIASGSVNPSLIDSSASKLEEVLQQQLKLPPVPSGASGNVKIKTRNLNVNNGGLVSVRNDGPQNAGTLRINANSINLINQGGIIASTASGEGGNISLKAQNLQLRNASNITATAGESGNGGNITINTDTLSALPKENSDISANAFTGKGGNVQITTSGLFGITSRSSRTSLSDITASSQFGVNGIVNIRNLGFEVQNVVTPFAANFVSTEQVLANSCLAQRNKQQGRFVVTGSGALPLSPFSDINEFPYLTAVQVKRQGNGKTQQRSHSIAPTSSSPAPLWKEGDPVVEAQAIVKTADGRTLLGMSPDRVKPKPVSQLVCQGN